MNLAEFFAEHNKIALAFSGGVDSSYLLYAALHYGATVKAYYVKSAFQPEFELLDAGRLQRELNADVDVIEVDVLNNSQITDNPANRCYYCKKRIFDAILTSAAEDGFTEIMDGTNASDDINDRPGFVALQEMKVLSPLRECGITKAEVRRLSEEAGLFTCDKPSYACLATRISTGDKITAEKLAITEDAEVFLSEMGFKDFRVRMDSDGAARIQLKEDQWDLYEEQEDIITYRLSLNYSRVYLDREVKR